MVQHNANDQWNHTKRILSALDVAQCDTTNLCYSISVTASECATFDMNDKFIYNGQLLCRIQCRHSVMVVAGWSLQLDDFCYSLNNIYTKKKYHITLCIMGILCDVRPHIQRFTVFYSTEHYVF